MFRFLLQLYFAVKLNLCLYRKLLIFRGKSPDKEKQNLIYKLHWRALNMFSFILLDNLFYEYFYSNENLFSFIIKILLFTICSKKNKILLFEFLDFEKFN